MDPFLEVVSGDVQRHQLTEDGDQWPAIILDLVQGLRTQVNLPPWVKTVRRS